MNPFLSSLWVKQVLVQFYGKKPDKVLPENPAPSF